MTSYQADPETVATQSQRNDQRANRGTGINHVEVIQTVIASLEQDESAMVSQTEASYVWKFRYGSVEVFVQLTGLADEDTFTVWSSVLKLLPRMKLNVAPLEMNWSGTFEACFGILTTR